MFSNGIVGRGLRGAFAGLLGGIVFGVWMAEKGALVALASMAGGSSPVQGLVMHLVFSMAIGASFGVLFSRLAVGLIPSILWGLVYGFIWWFLGPLTLMSLMLGMGLQWTASAVAQTIPSLIWHLVYGGVLGVSYEALRHKSLASLFGREWVAH
ncbi:MAG: hypothetical protein ACE5JS_20365 [Nitrospinota bacterium]